MTTVANPATPTSVKARLINLAVRATNPAWFVSRGENEEARGVRRDLLKRFRQVDKHGLSCHQEKELLFMVNAILRSQADGPLVECGCFKGGSTAKFSLVAKLLGKRLYVCDSFMGLPPGAAEKVTSLDGDQEFQFEAGQYACSLDSVKATIRTFGAIEVCEFVPGFFEHSLPTLDIRPSFVYMDVDLVSSARDCLRYLWPRLMPGGLFFTHEAHYREYVLGIADPVFWSETFAAPPPVLFGAGFGCGTGAGSIGYFEKLPRS
jgi:O-methyltransferase